MKVLPIKNEETEPWLLQKHYAKPVSQTVQQWYEKEEF